MIDQLHFHPALPSGGPVGTPLESTRKRAT
jgi:hypothetical protein